MTLPFNFKARRYQKPILDAIDSGKYKRAVVVWHRRAGKDKTFINLMIKKINDRPGVYYYLFPTYSQGKKILWDGRDRDGFPYMGHFPPEMIKRRNNQEMKLELVNGSIFQIIGTDNINSIVGTNPVGCIFSEYALQNPMGWKFISPILLENGGWAAFNFTPRGNNHGKELYDMARDNPDWFCEKLTVDDTKRPDGSPVISKSMIEGERREGKPEDFIQQEYYCSFEGCVIGNYYGKLLHIASEEGRIGNIPYEPQLDVETSWDIGISKTDATGIWFFQRLNTEIRVIDYYQNVGVGLPHYIKVVREKPYIYSYHYAPHDISVREWGSGVSRIETAKKLGISFKTVPKLPVEDGIDAVRLILPRCYFDKVKTKVGFDAMMEYQKEFNEKTKEFENHPLHNWTSHGADAFRTYAVGFKPIIKVKPIVIPQSNPGAHGWMGN